MRTRKTVSPILGTKHTGMWYRALPDGTRVPLGDHSFGFTGKAKSIVDLPRRVIISTRSGSRRMAFKPVWSQEWSVTTAPSPPQVVFANWNYTGEANLSGPAQSWACGYYPPSLDWGIAIANHTRERVLIAPDVRHYDRFVKAKPSMSTRAGLSVFLYELSDIKRMFQLIPPKHFRLKDWQSVKENLRYWNGLHLNYNFGWKPFIRDVSNTFKAVSSFEKRLDRFVQSEGKALTRTICEEPATHDLTGTFFSQGFWTGKYQIEGTTKLCSSFLLDYDIPDYGQRGLRWRAWADTLGLNINPSTIWAVVPWSFVIDWFYDVSSLLETQENDWAAPWITWYDACCSVHIQSRAKWWVENVYQQKLPLFTLSFEEYTRQIGFPEFSGITEDLNSDKIRLGTSLIASRIL